jgi:hypothetical protein
LRALVKARLAETALARAGRWRAFAKSCLTVLVVVALLPRVESAGLSGTLLVRVRASPDMTRRNPALRLPVRDLPAVTALAPISVLIVLLRISRTLVLGTIPPAETSYAVRPGLL